MLRVLPRSLVLALVLLASPTASQAGGYGILHTFLGGSDGLSPQAGLVADNAGNLYGTSINGGGTDCEGSGYPGCGVVFEFDADGRETVLHAFAGGSDGAFPTDSLLVLNGNLYGTAYEGGGAGCNGYGCGVVFKIAQDGTESVIYAFTGGNDGSGPVGGLIADNAGDLFGTTSVGGKTSNGAVFEIKPDGTESVVHSFTGGSDGASPQASLVADPAGNLYGTTVFGGPNRSGTVFRVRPDGRESVLYAFKGGSGDGAFPYDNLIVDGAGNLYGTTSGGGVTCYKTAGCGTVFELSPPIAKGGAWSEKVLHFFANANSKNDGYYSYAGLAMDTAGNLYGVTAQGGGPVTRSPSQGDLPICSCGTVFKLAPDGTETVLHNFMGGFDGQWSTGTPLLEDGYLYGTTQIGGYGCAVSGQCGIAFRVAVP
jgi:uncharacterized repeat protein (TIGR03803 family)